MKIINDIKHMTLMWRTQLCNSITLETIFAAISAIRQLFSGCKRFFYETPQKIQKPKPRYKKTTNIYTIG